MCECLCHTCEGGLGCCGAVEKEPQSAFTPSSQRSCTDILFLLAFLGAWAAFIIIFVTALGKGGSPNDVLRGQDYNGNTCGLTAGYKDTPYAAWPNPAVFMVKVCVASCNETSLEYGKFIYPVPSSQFSWYCIPNPISFLKNNESLPIQVSVKVGDDFQSTTELASRAINDMYVAWVIILISAGIAIIASFVYTWLNKIVGGCLVWSCIVLIAAGGFLVSYALLKYAADAEDTDLKDRAKAMKVLGWIFVVATVIFILITFFLRHQIQIAIEVVKEASRAVQDMKLLMFFPLFPLFFAIGYFAWWIAVSVYIFSVQEKVKVGFNTIPSDPFNPNDPWLRWNTKQPTQDFWRDVYYPQGRTDVGANYTSYNWNQGLKGSFAFIFFHLLWTTQFLVYFTYFVIAGCVANWYFSLRVDGSTHDKQRGSGPQQLPHSPVLASIKRTIRFHLGTIAVASLIIAIIQFIRAVITYIERRTEQGFCGYKPPEKLRKAIFCLIQCCLYCVQCCLDKISKNALVWTALWGDSFGPAVCSSFKLIWSNLARVAAVNMVGAYLILLGKLLVATVTTGICGIVMLRYQYYKDHLNSPAMPMVAIFLLSFTIATLFMVMYETIVDTIFICFLVDEKVNKGSHNMYAAPELIRLVDSHADASDKLAAKQREEAALRDSHITYTKKQAQVS